MPYKRSAAMPKAEPTGMALRGNPRRSGPWHGGPRGLPRIIQYTDDAVPANEYPARIVSPPPGGRLLHDMHGERGRRT
jgi:hypothetical protein